jgi:hypothetical protein
MMARWVHRLKTDSVRDIIDEIGVNITKMFCHGLLPPVENIRIRWNRVKMKQIALAMCFLLQLMSCNAKEPSAVGAAKEPSHIAIDEKDKKTVKQISIYVNLAPKDPYAGLVTHEPDGTPVKQTYDSKPKKPFPGYFELDGVGIDAKSKFWEIEKKIESRRNLRCDPNDCSHPHGYFSDSASIFMRLNRTDEYGEIYEFGIGGQAKSLRAALRSNKTK